MALSNIGFSITPPLLTIGLPLGISFYTFQAISYNVDVYRKSIEPCRQIINFSLYFVYFPKLISGPIERPGPFFEQLSKRRTLNWAQITEATQYLLFGYFQKVIIANTIGYFINSFFGNPTAFNQTEAFLCVLLYTIQIYADFSGYTLIVIGFSLLFGIRLQENFNQPYFSHNIQDFWRRWHITLSNWIHDYIYIPFGGNRKGKKRTYINLIVTMIIAGIWHGVGYQFIIWGLLHGIYLTVHRIGLEKTAKWQLAAKFSDKKQKIISVVWKFASWLLTFSAVSFAWIFFRASDLNTAWQVIIVLFKWSSFGLSPSGSLTNLWLIFVFFVTISLIFDGGMEIMKRKDFLSNTHWIIQGLIYGFIIICLLVFQFKIYSPFIYQGF